MLGTKGFREELLEMIGEKRGPATPGEKLREIYNLRFKVDYCVTDL